jgi:hypothetical protein
MEFHRMSESFSIGPSSEKFGTGQQSDLLNNPAFYDLPLEQQASELGSRTGCPVAQELIHSDAPGRGPENMRDRYGEVNFWYRYITHDLESANGSLAEQFKQPVPRAEDEPVGKHEPESVPAAYQKFIPATETIYGYSLPRMIIDQLQCPGSDQVETQRELIFVLGAVEDAAKVSQSPMELMARTAEGFAGHGANIDGLLKQMLGQGWVELHNAMSMTDAAKAALREYAPQVWEYYNSLSEADKTDRRFA